MANAEDLKIKISLTPSQETLFPEIKERLNSESEMMMDQIQLRGTALEICCHDLSDLIDALRQSGPSIEFHRFKSQAEAALQKSILACGAQNHQKKNFESALKALDL